MKNTLKMAIAITALVSLQNSALYGMSSPQIYQTFNIYTMNTRYIDEATFNPQGNGILDTNTYAKGIYSRANNLSLIFLPYAQNPANGDYVPYNQAELQTLAQMQQIFNQAIPDFSYASFLYATLYRLDDIANQTSHGHAYNFRMYINGNIGAYVQENTNYMTQFVVYEQPYDNLCTLIDNIIGSQAITQLQSKLYNQLQSNLYNQ